MQEITDLIGYLGGEVRIIRDINCVSVLAVVGGLMCPPAGYRTEIAADRFTLSRLDEWLRSIVEVEKKTTK